MEEPLERVAQDKGAVTAEAVRTFGISPQLWGFRESMNFMKNDSVLIDENWNT
jgi:hypothetical protein